MFLTEKQRDSFKQELNACPHNKRNIVIKKYDIISDRWQKDVILLVKMKDLFSIDEYKVCES